MKKAKGTEIKTFGKKVLEPRGPYKRHARMIREAREQQKLSQVQLAEYFAYHGQYVANWEAGVSLPPANILKRLSKILKIPILKIVELRTAELKEKLLKDIGVRASNRRPQNTN